MRFAHEGISVVYSVFGGALNEITTSREFQRRRAHCARRLLDVHSIA